MSKNISDKWIVLECPECKTRRYYCVESFTQPSSFVNKLEESGFDKEDLLCSKCNKQGVEIPYEAWNANDIAEIFSNEIEDRNHHWLTKMPHDLLNAMNSTRTISEEDKTQVLHLFMEYMTEEW